MASRKRKKPGRAEPVLAWCIVYPDGEFAVWTARRNRDAFHLLPHERIARVEIREVVPVRRRAKRGKP